MATVLVDHVSMTPVKITAPWMKNKIIHVLAVNLAALIYHLETLDAWLTDAITPTVTTFKWNTNVSKVSTYIFKFKISHLCYKLFFSKTYFWKICINKIKKNIYQAWKTAKIFTKFILVWHKVISVEHSAYTTIEIVCKY